MLATRRNEVPPDQLGVPADPWPGSAATLRRGYLASLLTIAVKTAGSRVAAGTIHERTAGRAAACSATKKPSADDDE